MRNAGLDGSQAGIKIAGIFLITAPISVFVIGLFIISISSWFSLGDWTFLRIYPFLPGYPSYCHIVAHIISYNPLYFCIVYCNRSFFVSNFVDLILLFFMMSLVKSLSVLFIFYSILKN